MPRLASVTLTLALTTLASAPFAAATAQAPQAAASQPAGGAASAHANTAPLPAKTVIDQAVKTAKAENKTVFVHVGASWCGWCRKLEHMLDSKEVGPIFAAHYVLVPLDAMEEPEKKSLENPGVDSVLKALGLQGGPPMYAFLDADGKEIATSQVMPPDNGGIGYPAVPAEFKAFDELLKKTAPRMTDAERATIGEYLVKNAPKEH